MANGTTFLIVSLLILAVQADNSWDYSSSYEWEEPTENNELLFNGMKYVFVHESTATWSNAKRHCRQQGAILAKISDKFTQEAIEDKLNDLALRGRGYWIDGKDKAIEGTWTYSDGIELSYTAWGRGEPNNSGNKEDCAMLLRDHDYKWNDQNCQDTYNFICQAGKPETVYTTTECIFEHNIDRKGSDLNNGRYNVVESAEDCCKSCEETSDCIAWTFDKRPDTFGHCWLKNEVPPQTYSTCCDSGYIMERLDEAQDWEA